MVKDDHHWDYEGECGPTEWHKIFPLAAADHQSPININSGDAIYNENLNTNPLVVSYDSLDVGFIQNNGHTFQITCEKNDTNVTGGPVKNNYKFAQFHVHWGENDKGSEHTIDNQQYVAEIHFVNWNIDNYTKINDAVNSSTHDGLLVLGVMVKIGEENLEFVNIINSFNQIEFNGQSAKINDKLNIKNLFPNDLSSYWTYEGSLTTPPFTQSVQWIVFNQPIEISIDQLNSIKNLYKCSKNEDRCERNRMKFNYRPVCPLNERLIYKSFI